MVDRPKFWVIPGALFVLAHVVTIADRHAPAASPPATAAATTFAAPVPRGSVVVEDARGVRSRPLALDALLGGAVVLRLPDAAARGLVRVELRRRHGSATEATPWLVFAAAVRGDGTIPVAGLAAGSYTVRCELADGRVLHGTVTAPGAAVLAPAMPATPR